MSAGEGASSPTILIAPRNAVTPNKIKLLLTFLSDGIHNTPPPPTRHTIIEGGLRGGIKK